MTEEKGPSIRVLRWRGDEVPASQNLLIHIENYGDTAPTWEQEKAYLLMLCATQHGCDMRMIVNALSAHWKEDVDGRKVFAHVKEMSERGILERKEGKYRVSAEAREHMRGILQDESKRSAIRSTGGLDS